MADFPPAVRRLIASLRRLPTVGPRGAERLAVFLLSCDPAIANEISASLSTVRATIHPCPVCGFYAEGDLCEICSDPTRDSGQLCVVEQPGDVLAIEKSGAYKGLYHVLGGTLSPLDGVGPDELNIAGLLKQLPLDSDADGHTLCREVIIALGTDVRGETTSLYLTDLLRRYAVTVSRPATGISVGGSLEFADALTLTHALQHRTPIN